jgi:hypothetical protein
MEKVSKSTTAGPRARCLRSQKISGGKCATCGAMASPLHIPLDTGAARLFLVFPAAQARF